MEDEKRTAEPLPGERDGWDRLQEVLAVVPGRWDVPVLHAVEAGFTRPSEMLQEINAMSDDGSSLSNSGQMRVLGKLTERGLLERREEDTRAVPPRTDYYLTPLGLSVLSEISALGSPGTSPWWALPAGHDSAEDAPPPGVNPAVPSPARIWNFWLGGKDNFAADREAARQVAAMLPHLPAEARETRTWQASVVRDLVALGVRQFLDIGTGLPTAGAVHEIAQAIEPGIRVVYIDNDPMVLAHARALLASSPEGECAYLDADLRNPAAILAGAARTLDLRQPVAIIISAVLHFIGDAEDPWEIVRQLLDGISGDAYLAISHAGMDLAPAGPAADAQREYNTRSPVRITPRRGPQVAAFFAGTELLGPGLVPLAQWPGMGNEEDEHGYNYAGLARRRDDGAR